MKSLGLSGKEVGALIDELRARGASDEQMAATCVTLDDFAISTGHSQEELDALRKKFPEGRCCLLAWVVAHPKLTLESEDPISSAPPPPTER